MIDFFYKKAHYIFGILFLVTILPFFSDLGKGEQYSVSRKELYNPELTRLNSVAKLSYYIDSVYSLNSTSNILDTALYAKVTSDIVKRRFYHGLSLYNLSDNWIAALAGKYIWSHLSAIVTPDDILKHPIGLCSQQTMVFLEILKRKGINFRTVGLGYKEGPGHFLSEVSYNGTWHLHDVTVEPRWEKVVNHHKSLEFYLQNKDSLFLAYDGRIDKLTFFKIMGKSEYGPVNQLPARKMFVFHKITLFFSYLLPILFFCFFVFYLKKSISKRTSFKNKPSKSVELVEYLP